jgi:hypothetical protein
MATSKFKQEERLWILCSQRLRGTLERFIRFEIGTSAGRWPSIGW